MEKQAELNFLTDHLLSFGILGDEPISDNLKLNEDGKIVDNANPETEQTWTYENGVLRIFDNDNDELAIFNIKQDENGQLIESTGQMELLEDELLYLKISEIDEIFEKITSMSILFSNYETGTFREKIKLNRDFSVDSDSLDMQFWSIIEKRIIFYSNKMTKFHEAEFLELNNTIELVTYVSEFSKTIVQPKVSVIVPVYNAEKYVGQTLMTLANQTMEDLEFIIVNDGSKDSSIDIINYFAKKDVRFKVVDKENAGVAVAINLGNRIAKGEYLAELDSDDYVAIDMYEKMYFIAVENDVDILKSNVINFTGNGNSYNGKTEKIAKDGYYNRVINPKEESIVLSFPMYAWVSLYKKTFIIGNEIIWNEEVSSYNDNGFYWQTMGLATSVMYLDEDFVFHRRDNELSTVKNPEKMERNFFSEHTFIKNDAKRRGVFDAIKSYFFERKINNYFFALNVIPFDKKLDFFKRISEDFKVDIERDGLNDCQFINNNNKLKINEIVNNPEQYFFQVYVNEWYKVSVVVPIHNAEAFLRNTLENLINQTLKEVEIILIENGSTDATLEIIKEYANKDPRIVWESIGQSNAGKARNVGLSKAHGKYIIFLDADDDYARNLLEKTFRAGNNKNADVVWFNTQERNAKNGLLKPHQSYAFNKAQMPNKQPFAFSEIKGNPYDAFIGWPWDKMFKLKFIQANGFKYQEMAVSNDGYFNFLAMSAARRIVTISDILVTRVVEHGNNISATKHDDNYDNQFNMITEIYKELAKNKDNNYAQQWAVRNVKSISWAFTVGFRSKEGASKYFDLLVLHGLDDFKIKHLESSMFTPKVKPIFEKLLKMYDYKIGEYEKFIFEVGGEDFAIKQNGSVINYWPNTKKQDRDARIIFGQNEKNGMNCVIPWFNIILTSAKNSNVSAVVDMMYMGNWKPIVKDTLNLSISIQEKNGELVSTIHQASWDIGVPELKDNIYYIFQNNVLTIYAGYIQQYTGFHYNVRMISTREGGIHHSIVATNIGYKENLLLTLSDEFTKFD